MYVICIVLELGTTAQRHHVCACRRVCAGKLGSMFNVILLGRYWPVSAKPEAASEASAVSAPTEKNLKAA